MTSITDHFRDQFYALLIAEAQANTPAQPVISLPQAVLSAKRHLCLSMQQLRSSLADVTRILSENRDLAHEWRHDLMDCGRSINFAINQASSRMRTLGMDEHQGAHHESSQLIADMPTSEYHSSDMKRRFVSKSGLDQIAKSPAHFNWFIDNPTEETPALTFGRAFHTMILEPEKVENDLIVLPDSWPTKKECGVSVEDQKENFRLLHRGKAFLTPDQMDMARAMVKSVDEHTAARVVLRKDQGAAEVTAMWTDVDTGVDCRARFDWLRADGLLVDLKTTRCAKPEIFEKLAYEHRYHVQAAFYLEAYRRVTGKEAAGFAFVAVEKEPPYCACVYVAQPRFIDLGRKEYLENLTLYAECRKKNEWPGYPEIQLVPLGLPTWAEKRLNQ